MARKRGKKRKRNEDEPRWEPRIIMPSPHQEMLRQYGLTEKEWEAMQERVRKRREQQAPYRKQMFEDYVDVFVRLAKQMHWERMEKLRGSEQEQQLDEQQEHQKKQEPGS